MPTKGGHYQPEGIAFTCNKVGHMARDCGSLGVRLGQQEGRTAWKEVECFRYQKKGHAAEDLQELPKLWKKDTYPRIVEAAVPGLEYHIKTAWQ